MRRRNRHYALRAVASAPQPAYPAELVLQSIPALVAEAAA